MKILHTSDWHLGQSFFTKSRRHEHQAFLRWLLQQVQAHEIDAVIVAGDIFDTGTPPSYARELYNQFVVELQAKGARLVVLAGNHDSVSTLNESKQLLACLNTHVIASTGIALEEQVLTLPRRGKNPLETSAAHDAEATNAVAAIICAVPYIRPRDVLQSQAGETGLEKRQALGEAIQQHYHQLYQLAQQKRDALSASASVPIIATGHLSALGVSQTDSVRDIYIGSLDGFDAKGFPPADYIALGHIHKSQKVAKTEHIRYSGSPIALSFDEVNSRKQVLLVDFADGTQPTVTELTVPQYQPMQVLKGDLAELEQQLRQFPMLEDAPELSGSPDSPPTWLCIEVETQDYLSDLQQRMQDMVQGRHVEVLQLKRLRNKERRLLSQTQRETLAELKPEEVFAKRLGMESFAEPEADVNRDLSESGTTSLSQQQRIQQCFDQVLEEVRHQGAES